MTGGHPAVAAVVRQAFERARTGEQVVVALPPGYGKTYGTIHALRACAETLKVLWFMPETHDHSLARRVEQHLLDLDVNAVRIHQLINKRSSVQKHLLTWPDHTQVKILAHSYLPLLFGRSPVATLQALLKADLIIVDENPFGALLTLSGTPTDRLPGGRPTTLPLAVYLADLAAAGLLRTDAAAAHALLAARLASGRQFQNDRQQPLTYLSDHELIETLQPIIHPHTAARMGAVLGQFWRAAPPPRVSASGTRQRQAAIIRLTRAAQQNFSALQQGQVTHGIALVQFPGDPEIVVRNATLERLQFGGRGVLYLDAFPHPLLVSSWLPEAQILGDPPDLPRPTVPVEVLVPEHPHDRPTVSRKAVYRAESHARHHAVVQRALKILGPRVVILGHQRFARLFAEEVERDYAPHTLEAQIIYWRASLGSNAYAGWDAFVVNEARLPRRILHLDFNAVTPSLEDRSTLMAHLEAADFLQLLHRTRPLTQRSRIVLAFDPVAAYSSPLIAQHLVVTPLGLSPLRGKSEHVLALELARTLAQEALGVWQGVPLRLFQLLFGTPLARPAEPWDDALRAFLAVMRQRYPSFAWLATHPQPTDKQERGLSTLLTGDLNLVAYSLALPRTGRGRPHKTRVWVSDPGRHAPDVFAEVRAAVDHWYAAHPTPAADQPRRPAEDLGTD
jgi:hypothetical protein